MKANFKIETEYLKKALEIFEPDEKGDRAGRVRRVRKVCFFPYGKWTLLASMTDHVAYFAIIKNRIPQPFSLVPESELNAIINKHAKLNFIVDFGGLGSISYIHPDQWKEYELDCVQISTINFDAEKKFGDSFEFVNYAKLNFACNKIPRINGDVDDEAFWDRWMIFDFENKFDKENGLYSMPSKLGALSPIFNVVISILFL